MTDLRLTSVGDSIFKILVAALVIAATVATKAEAAGLQVDKIVFEGNKNVNTSQLKSLLKTKANEPFNNKFLRMDRIILSNFYQRRGFLNVWIETDVDRSGEKIKVIFRINEGKQFLLGGIKVEGAEMLTPEQVKNNFDLKPGEYFQEKKIEEGLNRLERFYYNNGKPYVELKEERTERDSLIFITLQIREKETVHIKDIEYRGLEHVKIFVIRRELEIKKGDIYSREKIDRSQRNIYSTGLFDFVGMDLQALDTSRTQAKLIINVVEKKPRWIGLRFGVAYEQEVVFGGTFDFTLEFGHRNLFGTARTMTLRVIPSLSYDFNRNNIINPKNQFSFTYVEPWIGYTRTPGIFQVSYFQVRPLNAADYNYFTSSFQVRHEFRNNWQASGILAYNQVKLLEQDRLASGFFAQTRGQDFIYSLSANLIRDSRDNYLNPQEGSVLETNVKFAYANSRDEQANETTVNRFFKFILQWNRYQKFALNKKWILASRLRFGNIIELGKLSQIPVLERFYLGGASSVRGYREQLLGPVAYGVEGNPVALGGKLLTLGNIELRIPLVWLFWGEIFTDAGNVWQETGEFKISHIKSTSGLGLALVTPLGPIRFDYGIKHRPEKRRPKSEFHISISFAF